MMKILKSILFFSCLLLFTSCYDSFVEDFDYTSTGFAVPNPFRTVIADRDMEIRVGVSIGGKRDIDMADWARFTIDPSLLSGTGLELLPQNYYTLSDQNTFRVQKANLPVADVGIKFTQAFYDDPKSRLKNYALPFRVTESSLDRITAGKETSIVAIKYISTYHGTYYVKGALYELNNGQVVNTTNYNDKDLNKNITRAMTTISTDVLEKPGVSNFVVAGNEKVKLTVQPSGTGIHQVLVETATGGIAISEGEGTYDSTKEKPEFAIKYSFTKGGKTYRTEETLILRQDPLLDLRVETW